VILDLAWSGDGARIAAVTSCGYVCTWEVFSGTLLLQKQITRSRLLSIAWSQQSRVLLVGSEQGTLYSLHLSTRTLTATSTFPQPVTRISWSPHALTPRFFVVTGQVLRVFTHVNAQPSTFRYHTPIEDACWSSDGQQIALLCRNGLIEVWDAPTRCVIWRQQCKRAHPSSIAWEARGTRLAIGAQDGTVQFQEITGASTGKSVPISRFPIQDLRWGAYCLAASSELGVTLWSGNGSLGQMHDSTPVQRLAFDPYGTVLATALCSTIALAAL
jgi:WD40 repeat protein